MMRSQQDQYPVPGAGTDDDPELATKWERQVAAVVDVIERLAAWSSSWRRGGVEAEAANKDRGAADTEGRDLMLINTATAPEDWEAIERNAEAQQRASGHKGMDERTQQWVDRVYDDGLMMVHDGGSDCGHGARWRLDPAVVPAWLCAAVPHDVMGTEAGYPQLFRTWDWVDWPRVIAANPGRVAARDDNWPTQLALSMCSAWRDQGYVVVPDVMLWVDGIDKFSVEICGLRSATPMDEATAAQATRLFQESLPSADSVYMEWTTGQPRWEFV